MLITFSSEVKAYLKKVKQKDKQLAKQIEKKLILFEKNAKHPSFRTHKLTGKHPNQRSISITMSIRMVYILIEDYHALFVKIGTHDQVYKK